MVLFLFPDLFVLQSSKRGLKLKPTRYSIENHLYEATKLSKSSANFAISKPQFNLDVIPNRMIRWLMVLFKKYYWFFVLIIQTCEHNI